MDLKNVVKFNKLYALLTPLELELAESFRNATEAERELIVESLQPAAAKKPERSQQARCTYAYGSGLTCNGAARNIVHHNSAHLDFHAFTTEKQKKIPLCVACNYAEASIVHKDESLSDYHKFQTGKKSKHQQSLASAIQRTPKSKDACCDEPADANVHHLSTHSNYHEFELGKSRAQSAAVQLSANGEAAASTASSEAQTENAAVAAGGSNE